MCGPMSDYISTVALINGEPTTVSFTRAFLESLFPEMSFAAPPEDAALVTLDQLAEQLRKNAQN